MLTALTLSGFKAFGAPQRIEFQPITLLFGPNSGGKSSVLHALHYARELLLRGNADAEFTESGGEQVELGGFQAMLHRNIGRDAPHLIQIGLEFLVEDDLPEIGSLSPQTQEWLKRADLLGEISSRIKTAKIELTVDPLPGGGAYVSEYRVDVNGHCLGALHADNPMGTGHTHRTLEFWPHRIFEGLPWGRELPATLMESAERRNVGGKAHLHLPFRFNACPEWGQMMKTHFESGDASDDPESQAARELLTMIATRLFTGLGQILVGILEPFRYIGPIRKVPERTRSPKIPVGLSGWADGLAAWQAMDKDPELMDRVSDWLSDKESLNTGYWLHREEEWEISATDLRRSDKQQQIRKEGIVDAIQSSPASRRRGTIMLMDERGRAHHPRDVGIGYSQVIPVIAACLDTSASLVAIEQPELHLHPKFQTGLGKLFVYSALNPLTPFPKRLIIETHSEHVLLRLLRCVRDTTEEHTDPDTLPLKPAQLGVYYIQPDDRIGSSTIRRLPVTANGDFACPWPHGFFNERDKELP